MKPVFFFTAHPSDFIQGRLLEGSAVMTVASAFWDEKRGRLKVRRPPVDHIGRFALDGGGFTAARKWGEYPWSHRQYIDWVAEMTRDIEADFVAAMDYACEKGVDRSTLTTNRERIRATVDNELALRNLAPDIPWLPVLQGHTLEERAWALGLRKRRGALPTSYAGIGTICGETPTRARQVIRFYTRNLPGCRFHPFGVHIQALDADDVFFATRSWDSYCWNWARGAKTLNRPDEYFRQEGETWTNYTGRLARLYLDNTVKPRLTKPRNLPLTL